MPGAPFIRGEHVNLRLVESEDYAFIRRYWNDPAIRYQSYKPTPFTRENIIDEVEENDDAVHFLPCCNDTPVGFVFLYDIDEIAARGEIGYWILPDKRGNGYATEAAELCLKHAFDDRGLHKVTARVFEGNDASIRILEKLQFQQEGSLREHHYVDGEYVTTQIYGLLSSDR